MLSTLVALESSSAGYFVNITESTATHTRTKLILSEYDPFQEELHAFFSYNSLDFSWASTIMLEQLQLKSREFFSKTREKKATRDRKNRMKIADDMCEEKRLVSNLGLGRFWQRLL